MGAWRLVPAEIGRVLTAVEGDLQAMSEAWAQQRLEEAMAGVDAAGPAGADVKNALVVVLNAQQDRLAAMGARVTAGLVGVESAAACFEAAQEDMLAQCQSQMLASAGSGDFTWWYGSDVPGGAV